MGVVSGDPKEGGERAKLNFGHTLGHAIESASNYELAHGRAVSLGMIAALRLARRMGVLEEDFEARLTELLGSWNLPTMLPTPYDWDTVRAALELDKKNRDGRWTFILPRRPGELDIRVGVDPELVESVYRSLLP